MERRSPHRLAHAWLSLLLALLFAVSALAQSGVTSQNFYDDRGRLVKVVDSSGNVVEYVYDAAGNIVEVRRSSVGTALSIFNFTPQRGAPRTRVTISGQGFSPVASGNAVRFNGVAAHVISAASNRLVVTVPGGAATGPISVTAGGATASGNGFGIVILMAGAVLLVPPLLAPLTRVVGPLASRLAPGVGRITVLQVLREKARSAGTLAVVMVILGFGLGLIMTITAMKDGASKIINETAMADITVMNPGLMPPAAVDLVRSTDGVAAVSEEWFGRTSIVETSGDEDFAWLSLVDPATYFDVAGFELETGSEEQVRFGLGAGGAVVIGDHLADLYDLAVGDELVLQTPHGPTPFTVAGTFNARFSFGGELVASIVDRESFGAGSPGGLLVRVDDDADVTAVGNAIRQQLHADDSLDFGGGRTRVATRQEIIDQVNSEVSTQLNIFYGVSAVAAVVALLGMANTLGISVLQRRRELGLLRAVGARRRQISRSVLVESATLCAAAFLLALPLGYLVGVAFGGGTEAFVGYKVSMRLPVGATAFILVLTIGIAAIAAWSPARRAARLPIVDALRVE